jgi:hypothetical protein
MPRVAWCVVKTKISSSSLKKHSSLHTGVLVVSSKVIGRNGSWSQSYNRELNTTGGLVRFENKNIVFFTEETLYPTETQAF